jgi:RHS repeat-associated protein
MTVSAPGEETQEQIFANNTRFQTSKTTVGLGTSSQTFDAMGRVLTETSIGNLTTSYTYDVYGRLETETNPDNIVTTYTYGREKNVQGAVHWSKVERPGKPYVKTYTDTFGRTVRTESSNFTGIVYTDFEYNPKGQLARQSLPYFANLERPKWTSYEYNDPMGRMTSETQEWDVWNTTYYDYYYLVTDVTLPSGQWSSKEYNAVGDLIYSMDAIGGTIWYDYRAPGMMETVTDAGGSETKIGYDQYGRQTSINEPNAGIIQYGYNAYDQIEVQRDARGSVTENRYDAQGRLRFVTKYGSAGGTTYTYTYYETADAKKGLLQKISCSNGTSETYYYDKYGRVYEFLESTTHAFSTRYSYGTDGNLFTYTYPSGLRLCYRYQNGYLSAIHKDNFNGPVIWQLNEVNAMGQEVNSTVLDKLKTQQYNPYGQPKKMTMEDLMAYEYTYDPATGNMLSRKNIYNGQNELFQYDDLNRLTSGGMVYSDNGNIDEKPGLSGIYTYDPVKKHAVKEVTGDLPGVGSTITYTSFGKTERIENEDRNKNYDDIYIQYGPTGQRYRMSMPNCVSVKERCYFQNGEVTHTGSSIIPHKVYIYSPYGLVATHDEGNNLKPVATDHLGSIVAAYNSLKNKTEFFGYDAWGRRYRYDAGGGKYFFDENPLGSNASMTDVLDYFARGYTGHEHMDQFGLINMNGRMYDPVLGRMLSPDPYVPDGTYSQDFNRYSYARNNPLMYTDPSGEFLLGAIAGFWKGVFSGQNPFKTAWQGGANETKIWAGLFASDRNKNFGERFVEIISRFTWQLPQTMVGYAWAQTSNYLGQVDKVDYYGGATVLNGNNWGQSAVTLSSYIIGDRTIAADPNNWLFQHEYGHYLQSQSMGPAYIPRVGIPSLMTKEGVHDFQAFEQDANRRAFMYFNKNVDGFYKSYNDKDLPYGWDFYRNPLDLYGTGSRNTYYDYYNPTPEHLRLMQKLSLKSGLGDYLFGPLMGIYNGFYYRTHGI